MNKKLLKEFAIYARNELRRQIALRAATFGVTSKGCAMLHAGSDYVEVNNEKYDLTYKKSFERLFHEVETKGFDYVIEEVAYTWFNRLVALRFMEVHDYLPSRIRVLSSETKGKIDPDLLTEYRHADLPEKLVNEVSDLLHNGYREQAYRKLLVAQCNELHNIMPFLFEKVTDYTELLLPESLLHADSFINKLVSDLEESNFQEVEVLGWLYQYYMSERKEKVGGLKNMAVKKEDLPVVTQLFTPKWIVEYMVQNSLGKLYDEWKPENELASKWEYYLKSSEPLPIPSVTKLEDIKFIDPACGSGHILIYAFDLLYSMYLEAGYRERDIPQIILENNLYGIDIDKRAMQLASFALMMKGQEKNRRFLRKADELKLNILEFIDSEDISPEALLFLQDFVSDLSAVKEVIMLFENAKQFGSLLVPEQPASVYQQYIDDIENIDITIVDLINESYIYELQEKLLPLLRQAHMLALKYEVVVTNPPYHNKFNPLLKKFMNTSYKDYKSDLYSAFIYRCSLMTNDNGFEGMMTPFTWMFISSHAKLREYLISNQNISSLVQPEYHACYEIANVPICTFVIQNQNNNTLGSFIRIEERGAELQSIKTKEAVKNPNVSYRYSVNSKIFKKVPESPIVYWASENLMNNYLSNKLLSDFTVSSSQNVTGNNKRFLRFFWEIQNKNYIDYGGKWRFYAKGGGFRKWSGNLLELVDWSEAAREVYKNGHGSQIIPEKFWYKKAITWGLITSAIPSFRVLPENATFDKGGSSIFLREEKYFNYILSLLNSKVGLYYLKHLSPTLNIQVRDVRNIPVIVSNRDLIRVENLTKATLVLSELDWNSFETSWDFEAHPFLMYGQNEQSLETCYTNWETYAYSQFNQLKQNEEELNSIFIDLYGLQDELTPEVPDKEITIRRADRVRDAKGFLSYCVGLMMGRYSLDVEGLAYAGGDWDRSKYVTFMPDEDGILPLTEHVYFEDDVVSRLEDILVTVFGKEHLADNLRWLAESLTMKSSETPVERLRRYFFDEFYKDHCQVYSKRPIYWMIDSGKKKGFRALVYLHRYNTETLAKVRFQYVQDLQEKLRAEQRRLEQDLINPDLTTAMKKRYEKQLITNKLKQEELVIFDMKLAELANQRIALDLDDGVVVNYAKLQDVLGKIK
ncbi:BREX-1 system adenine-specific DNA-methyltransferase PglX [Peribacillus sp. NPDC097284]|uniref:BREX-1 system adenine-specific DNA-methyltransferase PglX n=1 Tax=Peribacillus sp. NPDC097284 TaxID=3364401 RepID=UPI0037FBAF07